MLVAITHEEVLEVLLAVVEQQTLSFLLLNTNPSRLTMIVYVVIFLAILLGLFSAREKKYGTAKPIKTLIINSIISYITLLFFIEYSYQLKTADIKLIILGSFLIGLAADGVSNQILHIVESFGVRSVLNKLFVDTKDKNIDKK